MTHFTSEQWRSFYQEESHQYDVRRYSTHYGRLFKRLHHEMIEEHTQNIPRSARLVEIACGTGHVTRLLQRLGFSPIACDLTHGMMERAKTACDGKTPPVYFVRANAFSLPFEDTSIDIVISTRFLHLFPLPIQQKVLAECKRILKPGGQLIIDFDNWSAHIAMGLPHLIYNLLRYRRFAPDTHYNRVRQTLTTIQSMGFKIIACEGVGGTHLLPLAWLFPNLALSWGRRHRPPPLRVLAEQFLISARRG